MFSKFYDAGLVAYLEFVIIFITLSAIYYKYKDYIKLKFSGKSKKFLVISLIFMILIGICTYVYFLKYNVYWSIAVIWDALFFSLIMLFAIGLFSKK